MYAGTSTYVKVILPVYSVQSDYMSKDEVIRKNTKAFREESGLSQQDLVAALGCSVDAVRSWDGNRRTSDRENVSLMCKLFDRPYEYFEMTSPPKRETKEQQPYRVFAKVIGNGPPGLQEALNKVVEDFGAGKAHERAATKKRLASKAQK